MHSPPNAHVHNPRHQAYEAHSNGTYITAECITDFYILPQVWTFQWHLYHQNRLLGRGWEDIMGYLAMGNHTNCVDLSRLSKSVQSHQVQLCRLYLKSPHISTTTPPFTASLKLTKSTCSNHISRRSLTVSETKIKAPTPGTHMHPTAIRSLIHRHTTMPFELVH